ncbi:MAG: OmpH family outer membrane protein, partial [Limisphaerales bacterium]
EEEWKKLIDRANDQAVSAAERDKSKQAAERKLLELRQQEETLKQFQASARTKLGEKHRRKRDQILDEIRTLINTRAKAAGYSLVIDTASESINSTPIVLYTSGENDLTDSILKELNAAAPASVLKSLEERK